MHGFRLFAAGAFALWALGARAQETPLLTAAPLSSPIRLDGKLDEPAWAAAVPVSLTQQSPHPGEATPFGTTVRALASSTMLYFGIVCDDPDPKKIAVHALLRDSADDGDDAVKIVLDPAGDGRNAYYFMVNARGALSDGLVAGPSSLSFLWDGVWDARTSVTPLGWTAEIAIPAVTLRFPQGKTSFRFNVARWVPRERMELRWSGAALDAKLLDLARAGALAGVAELQPALGFELRPFALARREEDFAGGHAFGKAQLGMDAGANLSRELKGELTINTDFAETEVDARQVNLTRFPLFFPEKRAFFLEGSNQFDFGLGLGSSFVPFYSRRIGLFAGGPVPIIAGAKVFGRAGALGIALLDVGTNEADGAERTNSFAGRVTYDVNEHLRVGTIATHGEPSGRLANTLGGFDAVWKTSHLCGDKDLLVGLWGARSWGQLSEGARGGWGLTVEYPNDLWDVTLLYRELGDALSPGLGFVPRPGTRSADAYVAYQPRPSKSGILSPVRQLFFEFEPSIVTDLSGQTQSWSVFTAPINVRLESGDRFEGNWQPQYERLDAPFEVSRGVVIPPGDYRFTRWRVEVESSTHRALRGRATVWLGGFYSGRLTETDLALSYTGGAGRVSIGAEAFDDFADLPEGRFILRLWQLNATLAFTRDVVLSSFVQYDSVNRDAGANVRLRWTIRPGTDLFIVWNRDVREPGENGRLRLLPIANEIVVKLRATIRP
ncbi:MAG TPA: DUF5916 domain-containing protein [Thermoanaerobaculia bacterium]|nr:DUF5916 domain-containing protein [Thermoanaerobaculia bacterium]